MEAIKAIGLIIGGTNISIGLVDPNGRIEAQTRLGTNPKLGFDSAIERMVNAIHHICAEVKFEVKNIIGIGIGCTGPVDPKTGIILTDFTLPSWGGSNLIQKFQEIMNVPVLLENNVDAAVYGEANIENGHFCRNVVLLTFGTGVGGGVLIDGQIYRGSQGEHPEIGHIPVRRNGPKCYCGIRGCLEMVASGTAIAIAGRRIGLDGAETVFTKAIEGDITAKKIIDKAVECTKYGIWTILHTFLPEKIILGGGVMEEHFDLFEPSISRMIEQASMIPKGSVHVSKAKPGNDAGIVGAALLSFHRNRHKNQS